MTTSTAHPARLPRHELSDEQLDLLAAGRHDDETLSVLRDAERSRRMLSLRLLLHMVRAQPAVVGPLNPVDEAWHVLVHAQQAAPEAVARLLELPQVGIWSSHTLRRLRRVSQDVAPLWFHVGQLHALAAAAAIQAGTDFRLTLPLWNGEVRLPTLGSLQFRATEEWSTAQALSTAGRALVRLGSEEADVERIGSDSGRPFPSTFVTKDDRTLELDIDDGGPYRGLEIPSRPEPLGPVDITRCDDHAPQAWRVLVDHHGYRARELSAGLVTLSPRPAASRFRPHSASVGDGFGHVIASVPHDAVQLAVTLVHEFQHSKLNAVEHLASLADPDSALECYAPWRDDPRPTGGLFHGVYAFAAVGEFWEVQRHHAAGAERDLAHFEFALLRRQLTTAVATLNSRRSLTQPGKRFVAGLVSRLAAWHEAEVPEDIRLAAENAAADHYAGWRANHVRPDPEFVRTATRAWLGGHAAPQGTPTTEVSPGKVHRLDVKSVLLRLSIADPEEFSAAFDRHVRGENVVDGAQEGDFALIRDDCAAAVDHYLSELSELPNRPGAWAGLGLALHSAAPGRASLALRERPELVRAVCLDVVRHTGTMPPVHDLAAWLGRAM